MMTIALTGGIATGKSSFAAHLLQQWGEAIRFFDCDRCVHDLLQKPEVALKIAEKLGEHLLAGDKLDRALLRNLVFENPEKRACLEGILHPLVREACGFAREQAQAEAGVDIFLADVPLLYETGFPMPRDFEAVVACGPVTQRERLLARNGFTPELTEHILASQLPILDKVNQAGVVIWNGGSPEALRRGTEQFVLWLKSKIRI